MKQLEGDLSPFLSKSPNPTKPMVLSLYDDNNHLVDQWLTPPGFQLERYVQSLYPGREIFVQISREEFCVYVLENEHTLFLYQGTFQHKTDDGKPNNNGPTFH